MDHGYQVLGCSEIAELLDVDKRTPYMWLRRGIMPEPDHPSVNTSPAWDRDTVIRWAARTGRLPASLAEEGVALADFPIAVTRGGQRMKRVIQKEKELHRQEAKRD